MALGLRKENASLEVYPDFPVELDALLSGEKNFSRGGGVFPYSIATQLSWKSMGKAPVCVCVACSKSVPGRSPSVHTFPIPEHLYQVLQKCEEQEHRLLFSQ